MEIRGAENGELAVPVNNTLVSHTAFLAADTRPCVLMLDKITLDAKSPRPIKSSNYRYIHTTKRFDVCKSYGVNKRNYITETYSLKSLNLPFKNFSTLSH